MSQSERKQVAVPSELYAKLSSLLQKTGAESVDELVSRILRDWVTKESAPAQKRAAEAIPEEDEKVVEERLRSLGYF